MNTITTSDRFTPQIDFSVSKAYSFTGEFATESSAFDNYTLYDQKSGNSWIFDDTYLIPVDRVIKFTPNFDYIGDDNHIVQIKWSFGDGSENIQTSPFEKLNYKQVWSTGNQYVKNDTVSYFDNVENRGTINLDDVGLVTGSGTYFTSKMIGGTLIPYTMIGSTGYGISVDSETPSTVDGVGIWPEAVEGQYLVVNGSSYLITLASGGQLALAENIDGGLDETEDWHIEPASGYEIIERNSNSSITVLNPNKDTLAGSSYKIHYNKATYVCTNTPPVDYQNLNPLDSPSYWMEMGVVVHTYPSVPTSENNDTYINGPMQVTLTAIDKFQRVIRSQKVIYLYSPS